MRGCHEHQLASYLDEFMLWERYGRLVRQCFGSIISNIATQYPHVVSYNQLAHDFNLGFCTCNQEASYSIF